MRTCEGASHDDTGICGAPATIVMAIDYDTLEFHVCERCLQRALADGIVLMYKRDGEPQVYVQEEE
jgi:hypothetical protein